MLQALGPGQANVRTAILLTLAGMLLFALNDVMGKWLVGQFSVGQVVLIRSLAALAVMVPVLYRGGLRPLLAVDRPGLHFLRAVLMACEGFAFYAAVAYLPLADTVTYWMAGPIYVAALASVFLGERVDWRGWAAILVGFVGVLIALRPSTASLGGPALIALAGSLAFSVSMVLGRKLRATADSTIVVWQMLASVVAGGIGVWLLPPGTGPAGWRGMTLAELAMLALLGVVAMVAHILMNRAFKHADAGTVMPFQYSILLWAVIFGALFFGDIPGPGMMIGAGLIVAAGLYIALRSREP